MLASLQEDLQKTYRIETPMQVSDYLISQQTFLSLLEITQSQALSMNEQILIIEDNDNIQVALFIAEEIMSKVEKLSQHYSFWEIFNEYCIAFECVSHFVYIAYKYLQTQPVSCLELELQSEVDKYIHCCEKLWEQGKDPLKEKLSDKLFLNISFTKNLTDEERGRYETANTLAYYYVKFLEYSFLRNRLIEDFYWNIRNFYRMSFFDKQRYIQSVFTREKNL